MVGHLKTNLTLDLSLASFDCFPGEHPGTFSAPCVILERPESIDDFEFVKLLLSSEHSAQQIAALEILLHHILEVSRDRQENEHSIQSIVKSLNETIIPHIASEDASQAFKQEALDIIIRLNVLRKEYCAVELGYPKEIPKKVDNVQVQNVNEPSKEIVASEGFEMDTVPVRKLIHEGVAVALYKICEILLKYEENDETKPQSIKLQELDRMYEEAICPLLSSLPDSWIVDELLPKCLTCCQNLGETAERYHGIRVLEGLLSIHAIDPQKVAQQYFEIAITTCQDTESRIRRSMCFQLVHLWKLLASFPSLRGRLIPELTELLGDEEGSVQVAALGCFVELANEFPSAPVEESLVPKFLGLLEGTRHLPVAVAAAKGLGPLYHRLSVGPSSADRGSGVGSFPGRNRSGIGSFSGQGTVLQDLMAAYVRSNATGSGGSRETKLRRWGAHNFPAMVFHAGPQAIVAKGPLTEVFETLTSDKSAEVREAVAAGLHEVCDVVGGEVFVGELGVGLEALLQDPSLAVRRTLNGHLGVLLQCYRCCPVEEKKKLLKLLIEFGSNSSVIKNDWRFQVQFTRHLRVIGEVFDEEHVITSIIPLFLNWMKHGTNQVQTAAVDAICHFIRSIRQNSRRVKLLQTLITTFQQSISCHMRLIFAQILRNLLENYSAKFVTSHFSQSAFDLLEDNVNLVRFAGCKLVPVLWQAIICAKDERMMTRLNRLMQEKLISDVDTLVRQKAMEAMREAVRFTANTKSGTDCTIEMVEPPPELVSIEKQRIAFELKTWGSNGHDLWELRGAAQLLPRYHLKDGHHQDVGNFVSPRKLKVKTPVRRNSFCDSTRKLIGDSNDGGISRVKSGKLPRIGKPKASRTPRKAR